MTESVLQVFGLLLTTVFVIGLAELVLWHFLANWSMPAFWPLSCLMGLGMAGLWLTVLHFDTTSSSLFENLSEGAALFFAFLLLALAFKVKVKGRGAVPMLMLAPAVIAISLVIIYPFFFELRLAFGSLNMYSIAAWMEGGSIGWVGLDNFYSVFTESPLQTVSFWVLLGRTLLWTGVNVFFHVLFGLVLAMILHKGVLGRSWFRMLLIVPWAMPQVVAILAWRGEFHPEFGLVNRVFSTLGAPTFEWWSDPWPVFISCIIVNVWLGVPFMMVVFLGGLQSIPKSLYEAAAIDGAGSWQKFRRVTLPLLQPVVVPSVTLGTIWTFNNINVIYLMTGQNGGMEHADILISALYKSVFSYSRYSYSAAFAIVIFGLLVGMTVGWLHISRSSEVV